jgi:hypothetical protein
MTASAGFWSGGCAKFNRRRRDLRQATLHRIAHSPGRRSGPKVGLDVLADQMQNQPRVHDGEGHVGMAIADMQVTSWNGQRIVPRIGFQVDSDHSDVTVVWQVHVESELPQQPAPLVLFQLNSELKSGTRGKLQILAYQFTDTSSSRLKLDNPLVGVPNLAPVNKQFVEIRPELSAEVTWMFQYQPG